MKAVKSIAAIAAGAVLSAAAGAQSFTLNVDPRLFDSGGYFASNPQTTTFGSGSSGIGTYVGVPHGGGFMSDYATVTASILDANDGTINFNDGYNFITPPSGGGMDIGYLDPAATSNYSFTSATSITVTVTWSSIVSTLINGVVDPLAFGMQDVYVGLDGNLQYAPPGFPAPPSGTFTFTAGAGDHVLSFDDASNLGGDLGTRSGNITEQLNYTITPTPEPLSLACLGMGVFGLIARRRARR